MRTTPSRPYVPRSPVALLSAALLALTIAACGSDDSSKPGASTASTSTPAASSTTAAAAKPATGAPIKIMIESSIGTPAGTWPGVFGAAQAAATAVNDKGGVNGRPLKLIECDAQLTPNKAVACARQAVSQKVVAYLGFGPLSTVTHPILAKAGIPVSQWTVNPADVVDKNFYPVGAGGTVVEYVGLPFAAQKAGAKKVAIIYTDFPGVLEGVKAQKKAAQTLGLSVAKTVSISVTQTNFAPAVQQLAASNSDAVLMAVPGPAVPALLTAARAINFKPTWVSIGGAFTQDILKSASKLAPNLWLSAATPSFLADSNHDYPAVTQYRTEMDAEAANDKNAAPQNRDPTGFNAWATTHAVALALAKVKGSITPASLTRVLNDKATSIDVMGIYDWKPGGQGPGGWTRVTDGGQVFIGPVKDGSFAPAGRPAVLTQAGYK